MGADGIAAEAVLSGSGSGCGYRWNLGLVQSGVSDAARFDETGGRETRMGAGSKRIALYGCFAGRDIS